MTELGPGAFLEGAPRRVILIPRDQDVLGESRSMGEAFLAFARGGSGFESPMDKRPFHNTGIDQVRQSFRCRKEDCGIDELSETVVDVVAHDHHEENDPPKYFFFRRLQGMVALQGWGDTVHVWRDKGAVGEWKTIAAALAGAGWKISKTSS
jgi:hypothetical protein